MPVRKSAESTLNSSIDRGYTDYSEKYALSEAEKFSYEL